MQVNNNLIFWETCENYLEIGDKEVAITSLDREKAVIYTSYEKKPFLLTALKIASYFLVVPIVIAFLSKYLYRKITPFEIYQVPAQNGEAFSQCSVIPTLHSKDTQEWRKKLIMAAEHNIIISGNYCGGKAFDEILKVIEVRMKEKPELQVIIIGHPKFIEENRKIKNLSFLNRLKREYSNRFCFVESPDATLGLKKITNHTKCMVIDYGKYFIQGGSGIKDNFNNPGKIAKRKDLIKLKNENTFLDDGTYLSKKNHSFKDDCEIDLRSEEPQRIKKSFLESFLPNTFRDQDFVFLSEGEVGKKMFREALFLAYKWDQFGKNEFLSSESWDLNLLHPEDPLFLNYPALSDVPLEQPLIGEGLSVLYRMLKTRIPPLEDVKTKVLSFQNCARKVSHVSVKCFFTGPEDRKSSFKEALLEKIRTCQHKIVIDQMYFQPSEDILKALAEALNRGVKVTVITTSYKKYSSKGEQFFGHHNRKNLLSLFGAIEVENRRNLKMYEYTQGKNGLHKKVVLVDDFVFAGSSNLGFKSLEITGDHEMNFQAESRELVSQTMKIIREDINSSAEVITPEVTLETQLLAGIHALGGRLWG